MSFFARLFAALARAMGAIRSGIASGYGFLRDAVEEAAEPIIDRLPWMRDRAEAAGANLVAGAGYGAIGAAALIRAPGAVLREVGSIVGSILPAPALTPKAVADHAVASDDLGSDRVHTTADMQASLYQSAAEAIHAGDEAELRKSAPYVPEHIIEWMRSLDRRDLAVAYRMDPAVLARHATAERLADCSAMLPPLPHLQPKANPREEIEAMIAKARRGVRPMAEPTWDDEPVYGARPAFH